MNENIAFGGIKRVPGGATGSDGDLAVAVDVCNDGMSLELLENPEELFDLETGEELLCIHEPEGEGKHYITQLVVSSSSNVQAAPVLRVGEQTTEPERPVIDPGSYVVPGEPVIIDDDNPPAYGSIAPYTDPPSAEDMELVDDEFSTVESLQGLADNGGSSVEPSSITTGIYLRWWGEDDGEWVVKDTIDITPYGKVTSVQPIGNTLVCNHEGGEDFPKEIRYWLWKGENEEYIGLGSKPPMIDITFGLESTFEYYPKTKSTFKDDDTSKDYAKYGGTFVTAYPYTDTVPLWWNDVKSASYVPPFEFYKDGVYTSTFPHMPDDNDVFSHWQSTYSLDGVESPDGKTDVAGMKVNWTTMVLGCYNKFIAEQTKDNKFVFPFYVRYAYEMYDGSLIMHSYPVLMIPNSRGPIFALDGRNGLKADLDDEDKSYEKVRIEFRGRTYGFASKLMYNLKTLSQEDHARLANWKDLIRGISVYITPPIYNYKQGGQVLGWQCMDYRDPANNCETAADMPWYKYYTVGKVKYTNNSTTPATTEEMTGEVMLYNGFSTILPALGATEKLKIFYPWTETGFSFPLPDYILTIPQKEHDEVMELHENAGQFYRFASIEYDKLLDITDTAQTAQGEVLLDPGRKVLATISNQDIMQDDNHSHDALSADVMYGYNRRLNMANVEKVLHSPLKPSVVWPEAYYSYGEHNFQITIYARNGAEIARLKSTETGLHIGLPQYLFYPNTDAFEALITRDYYKYKVRLKEHKALDGAYWLADFMNRADGIEDFRLENYATAEDLALEELNKVVDDSNKIYTSETDNPFYVPPTNINIAGGGEVRALCSAVEAMSQGQFGQHPMYTFTSEGVWAMSVDNTGGWSTIQPVARDVISAGTKPLSLDSAVVFMTNRGLLLLGGSETKVLSDDVRAMMSGEWSKIGDLATATATSSLLSAVYDNTNGWLNFPDAAKLMYDARNGRIYVSDGGMSWVYNLKSGLWTQATTSSAVQITSYPECETQMGDKVVKVSVDRTDKSNLKPYGLVVTQPFKFGAGGSLRRIHEMVVRGEFRPYGSAVKTALWGTRDWLNHALVASSTRNRLTRWGGSPYFAHSLGLFVTREGSGGWPLRIAGADFTIDGEHDNKLR